MLRTVAGFGRPNNHREVNQRMAKTDARSPRTERGTIALQGYLDGQPVSLIRHCYAVSRSELLADYQGGSLRRYLADKGLPLTRTYSLIGARLPNREEAARLLMPRHAPLLTVLTLSRDRTGQPVELAQSISRADRFQYQVAP
ncbi:hypothetical protein IPC780_23460 [Pseudomonas aeruginosa]|nr:hypothetical protein IPC780_23460 [Pseudomonas aeruginosa]